MCGRTAMSLSKRALQTAFATTSNNSEKGNDIKVEEDEEDDKPGKVSGSIKTEVLVPEWYAVHSTMDYAPGYNHAPSSFLPILISSAHLSLDAIRNRERSIVPMAWGLIPSWFKGRRSEFKYKTFNARSETMISGEKKFYDTCLAKRRRGLLLVEGYFEWTRDRQPHFFYLPQEKGINFKTRENWSELNFVNRDGVWKGPKIMTIPVLFDINYHVNSKSIGPYYSFAVITTDAHDELQWIHHRMPAILDNDCDRNKWLDMEVSASEALALVGEPFAGDLEYHVVTDEIGSVKFQSVKAVLAHDCLKEKKSKQTRIDSFFHRVPKPKAKEEKPNIKEEVKEDLSSDGMIFREHLPDEHSYDLLSPKYEEDSLEDIVKEWTWEAETEDSPTPAKIPKTEPKTDPFPRTDSFLNYRS